MTHDDFATEPIPGLPAMPPEGERILWRGAPEWKTLARRAFHTYKIAGYFAILIAWRFATAWHDGASLIIAAESTAILLGLCAFVLAIAYGYAYLVGRATIYTITTRRVAMRVGVALPVTINIPFSRIASAALATSANKTGDIPLKLTKHQRISYALLWPSVRPWRFAEPEPMLRAIPDAARTAGLLATALAAYENGQENVRTESERSRVALGAETTTAVSGIPVRVGQEVPV